MSTRQESSPSREAQPGAHWLHRLVRRMGWVLIRERELDVMADDAAGYYEVMKRKGISERNAGYFNGLADYSSKKALQLRDRYAPNAESSERAGGFYEQAGRTPTKDDKIRIVGAVMKEPKNSTSHGGVSELRVWQHGWIDRIEIL